MPEIGKPPVNTSEKAGPPFFDAAGNPQPVNGQTLQRAPADQSFLASAQQGYGVLSAAQKADDGHFYLVGDDQLQMLTTYEEITGLYPAPVAGPAGSFCRFVRAHANYWVKHVTWRVRRLGARPKLPDANTQNANEELLKRTIHYPTPQLQRDELTYLYEASGEYLYGLIVPPDLTKDALDGGTTPLVTTPAKDQTLKPDQWDNSLLKSTPPLAYQHQQKLAAAFHVD